ncbi:hypothetical protein L1D14_04180 [Vibrio tubiashii]|uniref:hypothetical protein n=1 Tax=Vibrio tubiashii TaxID=29498 RepID=UPI001EFE96E6|nr:hypothetical protein [Vibrio tubiashii]MCG9575429.1 hypothetical protein [Vibrio tubiashii]
MSSEFVRMTKEQINLALEQGYEQCVVEAKSSGTICWDISDTREREPVHEVQSGERFWCWNFKTTPTGYKHDYANMAPTEVLIHTDVHLELVYVTGDCQDPQLFNTATDKSPNWT